LNVGNRFPFQKLYDNCLIHTKEESDKILDEFKKDDKNVLRIFYELLSLSSNRNDNLSLQRQQNSGEGYDLLPGSRFASGHFNALDANLNKANFISEDVDMDIVDGDEEIKSENEISENSVPVIGNNVNNNYVGMGNNGIQSTYYNNINPYPYPNPHPNTDTNANNYNFNAPRIRGMYSRFIQNNQDKEIIPYKVQPDNIDLNNYNIIIENNQIKTIQSKTDDNFTVVFEAKMIKEQSSNQFKGLVSNSILKVYTSMYNKDIVNIIHIHLNDTSEEISVDSLFLEKSEMASDHKNFKLDVTGKKLNYKFIFRDFKVIN